MSAVELRKRAGICPVCKKRNHPLAPDITGDICDTCFNSMLEKASPIICKQCNSLAGMIESGITESGFEFKTGESYTVDRCRACDKTLTKLEINELNNYLKDSYIKQDEFLK